MLLQKLIKISNNINLEKLYPSSCEETPPSIDHSQGQRWICTHVGILAIHSNCYLEDFFHLMIDSTTIEDVDAVSALNASRMQKNWHDIILHGVSMDCLD